MDKMKLGANRMKLDWAQVFVMVSTVLGAWMGTQYMHHQEIKTIYADNYQKLEGIEEKHYRELQEVNARHYQELKEMRVGTNERIERIYEKIDFNRQENNLMYKELHEEITLGINKQRDEFNLMRKEFLMFFLKKKS